MTEQEATDKLEQIVGSVDKCFRLMRTYRESQMAASGNCFALRKLPPAEDIFRQRATNDGYSREAIEHYLNHIR